jgi:hypothetical protein
MVDYPQHRLVQVPELLEFQLGEVPQPQATTSVRKGLNTS